MMPVSRPIVLFRSIVVLAVFLSFSFFMTKCVVAQESTPDVALTQTAVAAGSQQDAQDATMSTP
jgi:hypothetical protein